MIDIIIPIYNEEQIFREQKNHFLILRNHFNLIFIDGESTDASRQIASVYGKVYLSPKGRGRQKDEGARLSTAQYLFFMNIDSVLDAEAIESLKKFGNQNEKFYGCFQMKTQIQTFIFRFFQWLTNHRGRHYKIIDADLGFLIHRDLFEEIGGFENVRCMEDVMISVKLRKSNYKFHILDGQITSACRRWKEKGFWNTLRLYTKNYLVYWVKGKKTFLSS